MTVEANLIKTMDYSLWFSGRNGNYFSKKRIPSERAPQEEQNGSNFSFQWGVTMTVTNTSTDPHVSQSSVERLWCDARVK